MSTHLKHITKATVDGMKDVLTRSHLYKQECDCDTCLEIHYALQLLYEEATRQMLDAMREHERAKKREGIIRD